MSFRLVPIAEVHESPFNPRKTFEPEALRELADSIKAQGVLTPLLARPRTGGGYELAAGHRRRRASEMAGVSELPLVVREMTDESFLEVLTVENLQREDVHPIEEADGYRVLIDTWRAGRAQDGHPAGLKEDVARVAAKVGKSVSYVYQRLKLLDLFAGGRQKFLAGELTAGHAVQIARLPDEHQKRALEACFYEGWDGGRYAKKLVSVRALGHWIEENVHCNLAAASFSKSDPTLVPAAGPCTKCPKRAGNSPLFADLPKERCTDPGCFQVKIAAFIGKQVDSGALALSSTYGKPQQKGALPRDRFVVINSRDGRDHCEKATPGVFVEGHEKGQVVTVCADSTCGTHHRAQAQAPSSADREQENKARAKAENGLRLALLLEIRGRVTDRVPRELLDLVARTLWERIYDDSRKRIAPLLGWEPSHDAAANNVQELTELDLARLLVTLAVSGDLYVSQWNLEAKPTVLLEAAGLYGVDVPKVRAAAAKKGPAKKKSGRVQTSAQDKKKQRATR